MVDAVVLLLCFVAAMGCESSFKFSVWCVLIACILLFCKEMYGKK